MPRSNARRRYVRMSGLMSNERSSANARRATADPDRSSTAETCPRPWMRSVPAVWKSADSSARRSHSRAGAIAASSLRRSSASVKTLEGEQPALVPEPERPIRAEPARADDPMARHEDGKAVAGAERPCRTRGAGAAGQRCELPVRHDFAARNRPQGGSDRLAEPGQPVQLEVDVAEVDGVAGEVGDEPVGERMVAVRLLDRRALDRQLVPRGATAVKPELAGAPTGCLVGDPARLDRTEPSGRPASTRK